MATSLLVAPPHQPTHQRPPFRVLGRTDSSATTTESSDFSHYSSSAGGAQKQYSFSSTLSTPDESSQHHHVSSELKATSGDAAPGSRAASPLVMDASVQGQQPPWKMEFRGVVKLVRWVSTKGNGKKSTQSDVPDDDEPNERQHQQPLLDTPRPSLQRRSTSSRISTATKKALSSVVTNWDSSAPGAPIPNPSTGAKLIRGLSLFEALDTIPPAILAASPPRHPRLPSLDLPPMPVSPILAVANRGDAAPTPSTSPHHRDLDLASTYDLLPPSFPQDDASTSSLPTVRGTVYFDALEVIPGQTLDGSPEELKLTTNGVDRVHARRDRRRRGLSGFRNSVSLLDGQTFGAPDVEAEAWVAATEESGTIAAAEVGEPLAPLSPQSTAFSHSQHRPASSSSLSSPLPPTQIVAEQEAEAFVKRMTYILPATPSSPSPSSHTTSSSAFVHVSHPSSTTPTSANSPTAAGSSSQSYDDHATIVAGHTVSDSGHGTPGAGNTFSSLGAALRRPDLVPRRSSTMVVRRKKSMGNGGSPPRRRPSIKNVARQGSVKRRPSSSTKSGRTPSPADSAVKRPELKKGWSIRGGWPFSKRDSQSKEPSLPPLPPLPPSKTTTTTEEKSLGRRGAEPQKQVERPPSPAVTKKRSSLFSHASNSKAKSTTSLVAPAEASEAPPPTLPPLPSFDHAAPKLVSLQEDKDEVDEEPLLPPRPLLPPSMPSFTSTIDTPVNSAKMSTISLPQHPQLTGTSSSATLPIGRSSVEKEKRRLLKKRGNSLGSVDDMPSADSGFVNNLAGALAGLNMSSISTASGSGSGSRRKLIKSPPPSTWSQVFKSKQGPNSSSTSFSASPLFTAPPSPDTPLTPFLDSPLSPKRRSTSSLFRPKASQRVSQASTTTSSTSGAPPTKLKKRKSMEQQAKEKASEEEATPPPVPPLPPSPSVQITPPQLDEAERSSVRVARHASLPLPTLELNSSSGVSRKSESQVEYELPIDHSILSAQTPTTGRFGVHGQTGLLSQRRSPASDQASCRTGGAGRAAFPPTGTRQGPPHRTSDRSIPRRACNGDRIFVETGNTSELRIACRSSHTRTTGVHRLRQLVHLTVVARCCALRSCYVYLPGQDHFLHERHRQHESSTQTYPPTDASSSNQCFRQEVDARRQPDYR